MNTGLLLLGLSVAGYLILGQIKNSQQQTAITACGGPLTFQQATCPQFQAVAQEWAWYPTWTISL